MLEFAKRFWWDPTFRLFRLNASLAYYLCLSKLLERHLDESDWRVQVSGFVYLFDNLVEMLAFEGGSC